MFPRLFTKSSPLPAPNKSWKNIRTILRYQNISLGMGLPWNLVSRTVPPDAVVFALFVVNVRTEKPCQEQRGSRLLCASHFILPMWQVRMQMCQQQAFISGTRCSLSSTTISTGGTCEHPALLCCAPRGTATACASSARAACSSGAGSRPGVGLGRRRLRHQVIHQSRQDKLLHGET